MLTLLRRLFWLALLGGAGYAAYTAIQERRRPAAPGAPARPPLHDDRSAPPAAVAPPAADEPPAVDAPRWVAPVDGQCPDGYPIKGNDGSGIYHVPGGRFYERTIPERCYADEDDAVADGYRRSKA